ncbi:hypothetical protein I4U23_003292 [Adineta vaga]|nr:hypothetical protein I4U23_003292 [Adineta vaga]
MESTATFLTLPVELVHRILDQLDTELILLSVRSVCKRFYTIVDSYNRLSIKFTSESSKTTISRLCRALQTNNVSSLSLKNTSYKVNMIGIFLRSVFIYELNQLRSLTLCGIDEFDLHIIINPLIMMNTIKSFSFRIKERKLLGNDTIELLSSVIAMPSLRKLTFDVENTIMNRITWPIQWKIYELRIKTCTNEQLSHILGQSTNLRVFAMNEWNISIDQGIPYYQLTSLTLNAIPEAIEVFESFLSLFSSLIYLKFQTNSLVSSDFVQRFLLWEYFIGEKLPLLKTFYFYFVYSSEKNVNMESILVPFCTAFWLDKKQWFVTARYMESIYSASITLHSPIFSTEMFLENRSTGTIAYWATTIRSNNISRTKQEWTLRISSASLKNNRLGRQCSLENINKLILYINDECADDLIIRLSTLINLSQLDEISLIEHYGSIIRSETIRELLEKAFHIQTLTLTIIDDFDERIPIICSIVSYRRIRHLKIHTIDIHQVKLILKYIKHVQTITFHHNNSLPNSILDTIKWLNKKRIKYFLGNNGKSIEVIIDKNDDPSEGINKNHKRIKRTHYSYT